MATGFFWYELMTGDVPAAEAFYKKVIGWNTEPFAGSDMGYIVLKAGDTGIGGMMLVPESAKASGAGPAWFGYIKAADIKADTDAVARAGGSVHQPPQEIPGGVGHMSVVADPQGAMYMLLQPNGPDMAPPAQMTPGTVGWCELLADDWEEAFTFYSGLYGWTKAEAVEMGEMGVYQTFVQVGDQGGGMMNRAPQMPRAYWGFYFAVEGIDAAAKRATDNGGQITFGPMEVPGGQWVVNCMDPQGAHFSMVSNTK